ncbi:MAG: hypothetical protein AAGA48_11205 [Myxococcota bacterium]
MIRFLQNADALASRLRPAWMWAGQLGVVVLGIHLAADRLDDYLAQALTATGIPWSEPQVPLGLGTWGAIAIELSVVLWAGWTLLAAQGDRVSDWSMLWHRRSIHTGLSLVAWLPLGLAGAWVVGMAVEDQMANWSPTVALALGAVAAIAVAWRLTWTGWVRVVSQTPVPKRRVHGWPWAVPVLIVAGLAFRHGLPIWSWLQ